MKCERFALWLLVMCAVARSVAPQQNLFGLIVSAFRRSTTATASATYYEPAQYTEYVTVVLPETTTSYVTATETETETTKEMQTTTETTTETTTATETETMTLSWLRWTTQTEHTLMTQTTTETSTTVSVSLLVSIAVVTLTERSTSYQTLVETTTATTTSTTFMDRMTTVTASPTCPTIVTIVQQMGRSPSDQLGDGSEERILDSKTEFEELGLIDNTVQSTEPLPLETTVTHAQPYIVKDSEIIEPSFAGTLQRNKSAADSRVTAALIFTEY